MCVDACSGFRLVANVALWQGVKVSHEDGEKTAHLVCVDDKGLPVSYLIKVWTQSSLSHPLLHHPSQVCCAAHTSIA